MWLVIQTQTLLVVLIIANQHLGTFSWWLVDTSTMEAEFVFCFEVISHGVWLKSFIYGLKIVNTISSPLRIFCDNSATVFMVKNKKSGSWSKYIGIKYLAIRERVKDKKVVIEHISMELMIIDPLTKGMPPFKFKDHVKRMRLGFTLWLYTYRLELKHLYCGIFSFSGAHWFIWEKIWFRPRINIGFIH